MTLKLWRKAGEQFLDANGDPLAVGSLTFTETGTSNLISSYKDEQGSVAHTNPILLNSSGRLVDPVYIDDSLTFKEVIADNGVTVEEADNYSLADSGAAASATFALPKRTVVEISDDTVLTSAHRGYDLNVDAGATERVITLDAVSNWANGHNFLIRHNAGTANIKLLPAGADTINGLSEYVIEPSDQWALITSKGDSWVADKKVEPTISVGDGLTGDGTASTPIEVDTASLKTLVETDATAKNNVQDMVQALVSGPDVVLVGERSQVDGGEASTANTLIKRYLDTKIQDRESDVTLASSVFTISRLGWCLIKWSAPGYQCGTHQANLNDDTNDILYYGSSQVSGDGSGVSNNSEGVAKINITASTDFFIEHKATLTSADGFGASPLFTSAQFTKVEIFYL